MRSFFLYLIGALVLAVTAPATAQFPDTYDEPPNGARYWEVQAFRAYPYKGPDKAVGALLWSHGLAGTQPQYQYPPPPIIVEFAKAGWDIVKVQRNPTYESSWSDTGQRHVADVLERVSKARAAGYKYVILAGQSYGGAISLEAADRTDQVFGVLAFAPGHGSDACTGGAATLRTYDMLAAALIPAIEKARAPRLVVSMAAGDTCQGTNNPMMQIESALQRTGARYIHFDHSMPIRGHGAAGTAQFSFWYKDCLVEFMTPNKEPPPKRTTCAAPVTARFMVPTTVKLDAPTSPSDLSGPWSGAMSLSTNTSYKVDVCVVVEKVSAADAAGTAYLGSGPSGTSSMSQMKFRAAKTGESYVHSGAEGDRVVLTPRDAALGLTIVGRDGRTQWNAQMRRGCL
jgi:pimeloyl-ACP methyl ester carboxylesterase